MKKQNQIEKCLFFLKVLLVQYYLRNNKSIKWDLTSILCHVLKLDIADIWRIL